MASKMRRPHIGSARGHTHTRNRTGQWGGKAQKLLAIRLDNEPVET